MKLKGQSSKGWLKEDFFKPMNERVKGIMNRELEGVSSLDGKPLNYSFKKIRVLDEVISMIPKEGTRKPFAAVQPQEVKEEKKSQAREKENKQEVKQQQAKDQVEEVVKKKQMKGPEIIRTISLANPATNETSAQQLVKQAPKPHEKKKNSKVQVQLKCTALFLSYNKIQSLENLDYVVKQIMFQPARLMWLDISHNRLQTLDCNLSFFRALKTLYIHCNYFYNLGELRKLEVLPDLRILMVYGNPFEEIRQFRALIIALLPQITKLDSALVSKKQRENALFYFECSTKKHKDKLLIARKKDLPPSDDEEQA